jgi:hypothetical protein
VGLVEASESITDVKHEDAKGDGPEDAGLLIFLTDPQDWIISEIMPIWLGLRKRSTSGSKSFNESPYRNGMQPATIRKASGFAAEVSKIVAIDSSTAG